MKFLLLSLSFFQFLSYQNRDNSTLLLSISRQKPFSYSKTPILAHNWIVLPINQMLIRMFQLPTNNLIERYSSQYSAAFREAMRNEQNSIANQCSLPYLPKKQYLLLGVTKCLKIKFPELHNNNGKLNMWKYIITVQWIPSEMQ